VYMSASRAVFTMWAPIMGACLLLCFLIKDRGLQRKEDKEKEEEESRGASARPSDVEHGMQEKSEQGVEESKNVSNETSRRASNVDDIEEEGVVEQQVHVPEQKS